MALTGVSMAVLTQAGYAEEQAEGENTFAIEEIVITAQRKAESLQEASISVDAVNGAKLLKKGIANAKDLNKSVPALTIADGGGATSAIFIRGVGNRTTSSYIDPAVAVSYDGVYMGRASAAAGSVFFDLERVEVLKGPQGTLYGRNATGGAINILPVKPSLDEMNGFLTAGYGNYDAFQMQGAINAPLSDTVALRVAGNYSKRDGFNKDGTSDEDTHGFRAQLLFQPNDNLSVRIGADYTKIGGVGPGSTYEGNYSSDGEGGYTLVPSGLDIDEGMNTEAGNAYRNTLLGAPAFDFFNDIQDDWYQDNKYYGVNAEINYTIDGGTFTIIPAWRRVDQDSKWGLPSFNSGWIQERDEQYSVEARFTSDSEGPLNYIVGGYFFNEEVEGNNTFNQEFVLPLQEYLQETTAWAAFGQLTYDVTDTFRVIGGIRYTDDKKDFDGLIENFITFCGGLPPSNVVPPASFATCAGNMPHYPTLDNPQQAFDWLHANGWVDPAITYTPGSVQVLPLLNGAGTILKTYEPVNDTYNNTKVTWRAAMEWDVSDDSMLYASFETGYRSGGFQLAEGIPTYEPEYIDAWTIGSKNRFLDGRLQLNAELFWWDYKDQQITYFTISNSALVSLTDNVGQATSKGADIDLIWAATENTIINAKVQYLDATYDDLHFFTASPRDNINCPYTYTGEIADGAEIKDFDCSGNQAIYSPKWSINLGIEQTFPIGDYNLIASVDTRWRDDQWGGFEQIEHEFIEAHFVTSADLTFEPVDGKWSVTAYIHNIEDTRHRATTQAAPTGQAVTVFGAPMTYGVRLSANF
ncbi:TonB-dependent receptor [Emcibacter nanhaiensis]|uniref:TonB-dependent receptor n=2 Tax=Emcibacter nanhaiensis TaxID=1505037 RepID=A0A501PHB1_9PROT|nr:TonB-dependent receptor [Emcibacter nanhaiensis]